MSDLSDDPFNWDIYAILSCPKYANPDQIRQAFRTRAKIIHPDKNADDPHAASKFNQLKMAYEWILVEENRERYNGHLRAQEYTLQRRNMESQDMQQKRQRLQQGEAWVQQTRDLERARASRIHQVAAQTQQFFESFWSDMEQHDSRPPHSRPKHTVSQHRHDRNRVESHAPRGSGNTPVPHPDSSQHNSSQDIQEVYEHHQHYMEAILQSSLNMHSSILADVLQHQIPSQHQHYRFTTGGGLMNHGHAFHDHLSHILRGDLLNPRQSHHFTNAVHSSIYGEPFPDVHLMATSAMKSHFDLMKHHFATTSTMGGHFTSSISSGHHSSPSQTAGRPPLVASSPHQRSSHRPSQQHNQQQQYYPSPSQSFIPQQQTDSYLAHPPGKRKRMQPTDRTGVMPQTASYNPMQTSFVDLTDGD